jgi:sarcosine oxidase subunit alpha
VSDQPHRLAAGGHIDRARPLAFTFNGRAYGGFAGDTLASALLANGVHLVGRSFKYHRPRGILSSGPEETNALAQLGSGAGTDPNRPATTVELWDGLEARSQNCWPGPRLDIGSLAEGASPIITAGFYYKTFMWPHRLWPLYERVLRHAGGLGRSPTEPDPDTYEHVNALCDVLVAGGGPAGLAAALAAAGAGARVMVAEQGPAFGGVLLDEVRETTIAGAAPLDWVERTAEDLAAAEDVRLLPRTTVFAYYDHNYLAMVERLGDHLAPAERAGRPRQRLWKVRAKQVVLATGAIERPLVFADNDRPGIMLAGAARAYLNRYGVRPGNRAVVFTGNDGAYRAALDMVAAGAAVEAIVDLRPEVAGELPRRAMDAGIAVLAGHAVVATHGRHRVKGVSVMALSDDASGVSGAASDLACDVVLMSGGWDPAVHLFSQSRGGLGFDAERAIFIPQTSAQAERSAGACNGAFSLAGCLAEGAAAGLGAAQAAGFDGTEEAPFEVAEAQESPPRTVWVVPPRKARGARMFVDFQADVTVKDLRLAVREGYRSVEHVKRYTTAGMGLDQGKTGNVAALAVVAEAVGASIPEIGTTTFRPPYTPVAFGAIAGRDTGERFDPIRQTPMHRWHAGHGAEFEDVGQWQRAWYYPRDGETMHDAVQRECLAARRSVGILDYSTLGKIDIQGRDAAELLNRVYTNAWSKLAIGRARYGLMLGEDGMVMDDGVTSRLGETHYIMTTTTGNAAVVLGWLEEWLQTEWPDLKVHLTSVSEQWATVSLCGPNSRAVVAALAPDFALDGGAFPHMSLREGHVLGVAARVARVSFTGELGFEISVPANHGLALWEACMEAGKDLDITPYGTEAMHVLRAEKGFIIVGQETDGSITPGDLGMDWIVSKRKADFIGKRSLARSAIAGGERKHLVGLLTDDAAEVLVEGAQLVETPPSRPPATMVGHVTSSYMSPNVGRSIALAMVKNGRERVGGRLFAAMENKAIPVSVVRPVFFDPEGGRLDG